MPEEEHRRRRRPEHARREHLARELGRRRHLDEVVERAGRRTSRPRRATGRPARSCLRTPRGTGACCDATAIAARKPTNIAAPPSVGVGLGVHVAGVRRRRDHRAEADREPAHDRRQQRTSCRARPRRRRRSPSPSLARCGRPRHQARHVSGYGVNFEQSRFACSAPPSRLLVVDVARAREPISDAISRISSAPMPAVVTDAAPSRSPLVTNGFSGSFGIAFLLHVIPAPVERLLRDLAGDAERAQVDQHQVVVGAARDDAEALGRRARSASAGALATTRPRTRGTTAGSPRWNATALAATTCISGPPCRPGNTALSIAAAYSRRHRIAPPRGPRSVLCVVGVTTSA